MRDRSHAGERYSENRVKADLPEAVLSYYDVTGTHYFLPSTVSL